MTERQDLVDAAQPFSEDIPPIMFEDLDGFDGAYFALLPIWADGVESIMDYRSIPIEAVTHDRSWLTPTCLSITPTNYNLLGKHLGSLRHLVLKDSKGNPKYASDTWGLFLLLLALESFRSIDMLLSLQNHTQTQKLVPWMMGTHISRVEGVTFERCFTTPTAMPAFLRACCAIKKLAVIHPRGALSLSRHAKHLDKAVYVHRSTLGELTLDLLHSFPQPDDGDDDPEEWVTMCMKLPSLDSLRRLRKTEGVLEAFAYSKWWESEWRTMPQGLRTLEINRPVDDSNEGLDMSETQPWWKLCSPATDSHPWHRFEKAEVMYEEAMSRLGKPCFGTFPGESGVRGKECLHCMYLFGIDFFNDVEETGNE